jgi:protein-S-isoprenylcysteine O-methyltransferase Ste14
MAQGQFTEQQRAKFVAQAVISLIVLLVCFYLIIHPNSTSAGTLKWAFGMVGLVVGYWLK